MKRDLDSMLRAQARRELREPPADLAAGVLARLDTPVAMPRALPRSRALPFALVGGLAAAALATWILWPGSARQDQVANAPSRSAPEVALGLTSSGWRLAANLNQPLENEWQLLKRDSRQLYTALLSQLPSLPRAQ